MGTRSRNRIVASAFLVSYALTWPAAARAQWAEPSAPPPDPKLAPPPPSSPPEFVEPSVSTPELQGPAETTVIVPVPVPVAVPVAAEGPPAWAAPQQNPGTHFLLETSLGLAVPAYEHLSDGYGLGASLGVGGKLAWFPPRFYLMFSFLGDSFTGSARNPVTGTLVDSTRDELLLAAGLRVAFPLWSPLRLVFDVFVGGLHTDATAHPAGGNSVRERRWDTAWQIAAALQYRFSEHFSAGVRISETFSAADLDVVAAVAGDQSMGAGRTDVEVTIGYHF